MKNPAYPELAQFVSSGVKLFNNYHGIFTRDLPASIHTIIYTCFGEVCNEPALVDFLTCFKDRQCIVVTARQYPVALESTFNCKIFCVPSAYAQYVDQIPPIDDCPNRTEFKKRFLALNNRAQWDRQALFQFITKFHLQNQFYFSYHCEDRWQKGRRAVYDECNNIIGNTWFNQGLNLDHLFDQLPITAGLDRFSGNDWGAGNPQYYWQSFASLVHESYIDENFNVYFSEKIMKPLAYGHPFLVFCSAGSLKHLSHLGFQTFENVFNEQYDMIPHPQLRLESIFVEIDRVCKLSNYDIDDLYLEARPRAAYNKEFFYSKFRENYQQEITAVCAQISNLL